MHRTRRTANLNKNVQTNHTVTVFRAFRAHQEYQQPLSPHLDHSVGVESACCFATPQRLDLTARKDEIEH